MQAHAGHPRRVRACAAALLAGLLTLCVAPVGAQASSPAHVHRHIARAAVVLPTLVADPGHSVDHGAILPDRPPAATALVPGSSTADSSSIAMPRTAKTPPVRGPPSQGSA